MSYRRVILTVCLLAIMVASSLFAQAEDELIGRWEGTIEIPQMPLDIVLLFENDPDCVLFGLIDIPQQGAIGLELVEIEIEGNQAQFAIADVPGNPRFMGEISDDGSTMSGEFTQNEQSFAFEVTYEDPQKAAERMARLRGKVDRIQQFADSMLAVWEPPGFAIGIVYRDSVVLAEGYGYRDLEDSLSANEKTLYAIGSTTKAFTTAAISILVDEGLLEWEGKVIDYLPDFRLWDEYATYHMNLVDLVTHRSGLPRHDLVWYNAPITREEIIGRLQYLEPTAELRSRFQYNNLMFVTAGYIVGQMTGSTWEEFVQAEILDPLGMDRSNFSVEVSRQDDNHARPYRLNSDGEIELTDFRNLDHVGPAGSINSCVEDMCQWLRLQLGRGEYDGFRIISEEQINNMHAPHVVSNLPSAYDELSEALYGLGWGVQMYRGHKIVWHDGGIDGFYTRVALLPEDNLGIVAFVNLPGNQVIDAMLYYIADEFLELEPIDWTSRLKSPESDEDEETEDKAEDMRVEDTKPSHKLKDYAGKYEHPGYGVITIDYRDKKLYAEMNRMESVLEHWHYDVFRITDEMLEETKLQFLTNLRGDIDRLGVALEAELDDIIFEKQANARLYDPEFLSKLVGEYELKGVISKVYFKNDNTLGLTVPGQRPYTLTPYRGTEFNIEGLNGFSLRFEIDDDDEHAEEVTFIQPNGVFTAKRQ
ncbi:MAG: serine hydrolase [candidate division Zixibacteria bacterium]|nr:serine hydrolase [candidate division Zixibacteria bacterium]